MKYLIYLFFLLLAVALPSCIEDGVDTDPSTQPTFSTDTLQLGTVFTGECTPTFSFKVYNTANKIMRISSVGLRGDVAAGTFRLNVDGMAGTTFSDVEIRPNDSIYIFVEATLPVNGLDQAVEVVEHIDLVTNGRPSSVVLAARGQDVERLYTPVIAADTRWSGRKPRIVMDSLVIASGATLTIDPGVEVMFHDGAYLHVDGSLQSVGTAEAPIIFSGDRTGNVVVDISFDLMAAQWGGIELGPTSHSNLLEYVTVKNTTWGVIVDNAAPGDGTAALTLVNCRLRNSAGYALAVAGSSVVAIGCEIADAASGAILLVGGNHYFNHCTFANYYLFSAIGGALVQMEEMDDISVSFDNCILYGLGSDLSPTDIAGYDVALRRCLIKSAGEDDLDFINCIYAEDPLYYVDREAYIFDYRLQEGSPAIGAAESAYDTWLPAADYWGTPAASPANIGAYN